MLLRGDARQLPLADHSVDAVVCDPPYVDQLRIFGATLATIPTPARGQTEDDPIVDWTHAWGTELYRVLRPGGRAFVFSSARTCRYLASAVPPLLLGLIDDDDCTPLMSPTYRRGGLESAGLIFQCLHQWLYGTGHPRGTGVKPAWEAIVVVRKPRAGERPRQIRVTRIDPLPTLRDLRPKLEDPEARAIAERILRDPDSDRSGLDEHPAFLGAFDHLLTGLPMSHFYGPDWWEPGESFYVPKPSVDEQNAGLEDLPRQTVTKFGVAKTPRQNTHPTPKPVKLMRTLVTQACPAGGTVLDPFAGSGTTGMACVYEGRAFIGIERDAAYLEIATRRIAYAQRLAGHAG